MIKEGSRFGFILVLLGGILSIVIAINLLGPFAYQLLLAAYYAISGALMLTFSFRIKRRRTIISASWIALLVSIASLIIAVVWLLDLSYLVVVPFVISILGSAIGIIDGYLHRGEESSGVTAELLHFPHPKHVTASHKRHVAHTSHKK